MSSLCCLAPRSDLDPWRRTPAATGRFLGGRLRPQLRRGLLPARQDEGDAQYGERQK